MKKCFLILGLILLTGCDKNPDKIDITMPTFDVTPSKKVEIKRFGEYDQSVVQQQQSYQKSVNQYTTTNYNKQESVNPETPVESIQEKTTSDYSKETNEYDSSIENKELNFEEMQ